MPSFPDVLDLSTLTAADGVRFQGTGTQRLGWAIASLGDLDGDGIADIIVSDRARTAYIIFGQAGGLVDFDTANLPAGSITINGTTDEGGGLAVGPAGDVNGDGLADILFGLPNADSNGLTNNGATVILYGQPGGFPAVVETSTLASGAGTRFTGAQSSVYFMPQNVTFAFPTTGVGDVNADGYDDVLFPRFGDTLGGGVEQGSVWLAFGGPGLPDQVALDDPSTGGFRLDGLVAGDGLGFAAAAAGDINGDGIADFMVSALAADSRGRDGNGAVYVIFGRAGLDAPDLANLDADGFRIDGPSGLPVGFSIGAVGDVNGDGIGDIVVDSLIAAWLIFGRSTGFSNIDLANPGPGVVPIGGTHQMRGSTTIAGNGDVNGDGFGDFLISNNTLTTPGGSQSGGVFLVYGRADWTGVDLYDPATGTALLQGFITNGLLGTGMALADMDGDGFADLVLGASNAPTGGGRGGRGYIVYSPSDGPATQSGTTLAEILRGGTGLDILHGRGGDDTLRGLGDADELHGGEGDDSLDGGDGDDLLDGGDGNDLLDGGDGQDTLDLRDAAGPHAVSLALGLAAGGQGFKALVSVENVLGGCDIDLMEGSDAGNRLAGFCGEDVLSGGGGDDTLEGGEDDDLLEGGDGNDVLDGGDGYDLASYTDAAGGVFVSLLLTGPQDTQGDGIDELIDIEDLLGSVFDDTLGGCHCDNLIQGDTGADVLFGADGDDTLEGGADNDTLYGGAGDDTMEGGDGDDAYLVEEVGDRVFEAPLGGFDIAYVAVDGWAVAADIELAILVGDGSFLLGAGADDVLVANAALGSLLSGGAGDDALWGQDARDQLLGGTGNDLIRAGAGRDTLNGGEGDDKLVGGLGADRFVLDRPDWGFDEIFDFSRAEGDRVDLGGTGILRLVGTGVALQAGDAVLHEVGGSSQLVFGAAVLNLYGATGLGVSDFIL